MNTQYFISRKIVLVIFLQLMALIVGCAKPGKKTGVGAGAGAITGAAIGGAAGGLKGAGIGAVAGAVAGGSIGNYLDRQAQELSKVVDTRRTENGILVNLKNDLLFETGKADVKSAAEAQLEELGAILAKYPEDRIRIAGYTDSVGASNKNHALSLQRAQEVRRILLDQGVKDEQLRTQGFGETHPVASNASASGRSKNRRVELFIDVPNQQSSND